uniref:Family with sequence similarity 127, member A n=1 Tax=Pan troglodytes TaxID=9598 RepID=K7BYT4_PANTR
MGGGRGLLGRETLGPGGGCSGEGPLCYWPPPGSPPAPSLRASLPPSRRDVPCAPVPSRVVLAFVPGIALQAPAAAPGPHSGAGCLRPLVPAQPLPCTFGRCPALQLHKAELLLHTDRPLTAAAANPPPPHQTSRRLHHSAHRPALPQPSPSIASHRQTAAPSDLDSPRRYLGWPQSLDSDPDSWPPPKGSVTFSETYFLPTPRNLLCSCLGPGVPGSQIESLIFSCGPVSFAHNPVF